jgi:phage-related protein
MAWEIAAHAAAEKEIDEQPADIRAKLDRLVSLIKTFGLERIPAKYAQHLQDELWEFRLIGKDGIARALYVTRHGQRIVIVRVFTKKTQKMPRREIKIALQRAKDIP